MDTILYFNHYKKSKVEIDYTKRMNMKKPAGAKPGFVIYHTNYSKIAEQTIHGIEEVIR